MSDQMRINLLPQDVDMEKPCKSVDENHCEKAISGKVAAMVDANLNADRLMQSVLRMSREFNDGYLCAPCQKEGIDFYPVGRNASHEFYLGVKDGRMYRMAIGEDSYETYKPEDACYVGKDELFELGFISTEDLLDDEGVAAIVADYNTYPVYKQTITEVNPGEIMYLGHY